MFPLAGRQILSVAKANGAEWWEQRRLVLRHLTDLGMGKRDTMEDIIGQEAQQVVRTFGKKNGSMIEMSVSERIILSQKYLLY